MSLSWANFCWAKKRDEAGYKWLPLSIHLKDTANIIAFLWEKYLSKGQKKLILKSIGTSDDSDGIALAVFLGAVHDIGKATPVFQIQRGFNNSEDLDNALLDVLAMAGFADLKKLTRTLNRSNNTHHSLTGQYLLQEFGVKPDISSIIGAHHGKPIKALNYLLNYNLSYPAHLYQYEEENEINKKWKRCQKQIFEHALDLAHYKAVADIPTISQEGAVIMTGLLVMADWIASNEEYFELIDIPQSISDIDYDCEEFAKSRYEKACATWKKNNISTLWKPNRDFEFCSRFGVDSPRKAQEVFVNTIKKSENPGIFIFEAPMGIGKTEAALAGAEILAEKTGASGLFFGLPTQATSNGIFPRIESWLQKMSALNKGNYSLRLHHGNAGLNKDFQELLEKTGETRYKIEYNIDVDDVELGNRQNHSGVSTNAWFSGRKRAILDDFVVGTVDQFLMAGLKQKHLFLRYLGLTKKVIILDEVHSFDAYMSVYLDEVLVWMGAYGIPVIILSATLPGEKRIEFITSYLKGRGTDLEKLEKEVPLEEIKSTSAYPLVTYTDGDKPYQEKYFFTDEKNERDYDIEFFDEGEEFSKSVQLIKSIYEDGAILGVIVNTVKKAQKLARLCEDFAGKDLIVLHSSFLACDRIDKESDLIKKIGKGSTRPSRLLVIGTQVIEQSLDIDFDVMITDLAPMDLIFQRMGRLHRHDITRPVGYEIPKMYILGTSSTLDFDRGSQAVYGGYLLARTQFFLKSALKIPGDISPMVQNVYRKVDDDIAFEGEAMAKYEEYKNRYERKLKNKEEKAKTFRISDPGRFGIERKGREKTYTIMGWLDNMHENQSEAYGLAQVRDSAESIEVILVKEVGGGYSFLNLNENIADRINEPHIAMKLASSTVKLPGVLIYPDKIDKIIEELEKINMKRLAEWQENVWLKGLLGLILKNGRTDLCGYELIYDDLLGLMYAKEEDYE